jgi:hypothetical protein
MRHIMFTRSILIFVIVALFVLFAPPSSQLAALSSPQNSQPNAPLTEPITLIDEDYERFTVGGGLLYWVNDCFVDLEGVGGSPAILERKPRLDGVQRRLHEVSYPTCRVDSTEQTFVNLTADDSGLYYYDRSARAIQHVSTGSSAPVKFADMSRVPTAGLAQSESALYFAQRSDGPNWEIIRLPKIGIPMQFVAFTPSEPTTMLYTPSYPDSIFWVDGDALWQAWGTCSDPQCSNKRSLAKTFGKSFYLTYSPLDGRFREDFYWVERTGTGDAIIRHRTDRTTDTVTVETLYPTSGGAKIIGLATNGNELFWMERLNTSLSQGVVRRMSKDGGSPQTIYEGLVGEGVAVDEFGVIFGTYDTIAWLPFNADAIVRDLAVDQWEITQGIQNLANDVPLVANKPTYVRVYAHKMSGDPVNIVDVRLYGNRNGSPLPGSPLLPVEWLRETLGQESAYDRADANLGFLFQLPDSWLSPGAVELQVIIDPSNVYDDPNRNNNVLSATPTFLSIPPACPIFIPVRTHAPLPSTTDRNFGRMIDLFKRLWPVPDVWVYKGKDFGLSKAIQEPEVCWKWGFIPYPCGGPFELNEGASALDWYPDKDEVILRLTLNNWFSKKGGACTRNHVGMVHPDSKTGGRAGYASRITRASWVVMPTRDLRPPLDWTWPHAGVTLAQELAHNVGRRHVDCGNPSRIDNAYPYPPCQLDFVAPDSHYGYDINQRVPIPPDSASDFMSYSPSEGEAPNWRGNWTSDYTWKALIEKRMVVAAQTQASASQNSSLDSETLMLVTGAVDRDAQQGQLEYVYVVPSESLNPELLQESFASTNVSAADAHYSVETAYHIRLLNITGTVILEEEVDLWDNDAHEGHQTAVFAQSFLKPAEGVARIELLADSTVLSALTPGLGKPTVSILQPTEGVIYSAQMTITWQASDPDTTDRLLYVVQYSHDQGVSWQALATNYYAQPDESTVTLTLSDLEGLPGSNGKNALIRVIASDGYNTAVTTSPLFEVTDRLPEPYIVSPAPGQTFAASAPVALRGDGNDEEDGGLSGQSLEWAVDGQIVGHGEELLVEGLAPGLYTVSLRAQDSKGHSQTAQSALEILPLPIPLATEPHLDGFCNDESYANSTALRLLPYADGNQATVYLVRTDEDLWACFNQLKKGAALPGAFAALGIDLDQSRHEIIQTDDYRFSVGEDGTFSTLAGDGIGGFTNQGPGGLSGRVSADELTWNAEMKIDGSVIGGWNHPIGLNLRHNWVQQTGDDYPWPHAGVFNRPNTWGATLLGNLPQITSLVPFTAVAGAPSLHLVVHGLNFRDGAVLRWNDQDLPTSYVNGAQLEAEVSAAQMAVASEIAITVREPSLNDYVSNPQYLVLNNPTPHIDQIDPAFVAVGHDALTLTVVGANFLNTSSILWNGELLPTEYVSTSQLIASIDVTKLTIARTVGITVISPEPGNTTSNTLNLSILLPRLFLPVLVKEERNY